MYLKDFDSWNNLKKKLDAGSNKLNSFPKEKEVWIADIGVNIGYEQNGNENNFSRPVLIIKKFNNHMFWAVPLSTKQKDLDFYFNYIDRDDQKVSAILAQMKLISIKRLKRDIYIMPDDLFDEIKEKLKSFL